MELKILLPHSHKWGLQAYTTNPSCYIVLTAKFQDIRKTRLFSLLVILCRKIIYALK